jgi:3-dehydroquinate synthase
VRPAVEVVVATRPPHCVRIGRGVLREADGLVASCSRVAVLSDLLVAPLHAVRLGELARAPRLELEPGEASKDFATLERVLDFLADAGLDRRSAVVALGGGVVGDVGGLAVSLYMRGIALVQCPTTLLAQVDAAVGGKTAVNLRAGKNLAGTFHPPLAVLADAEVLATLPAGELRSGLGEVLKTALVGDGGILAALEESVAPVLAGDPDALAELVVACVRVKAAIVGRDERETGERRALNLGHTFAHAIEHAAGYGRVPHGEAVAVGLALALAASRELGLLRDPELPARLAALAERLGLPRDLAELRHRRALPLPATALLAALRRDKKADAGEPAFVLPRAVGELELAGRLPRPLLERLLA